MLNNETLNGPDISYSKTGNPTVGDGIIYGCRFSVDSDSSTDDEDDSYIHQHCSYVKQYGGGPLITRALQYSGAAVGSGEADAAMSSIRVIKSYSLSENTTNGGSNGGQELPQRQEGCEGLSERIKQIRSQPKNISPFKANEFFPLLPPPSPSVVGKKCLVLDLDETLLHSTYVEPEHYDHHLVIQKDNSKKIDIYTTFRPHLQCFLDFIAPLFEVVIFTASSSVYCNTLLDFIDPEGKLGKLRMFREHCIKLSSNFVKDLSLLGRDLEQVVIIDNSPMSYILQHRNAMPISSWLGDSNDCELARLTILLEALVEVDNVYDLLDNYNALLQQRRQ